MRIMLIPFCGAYRSQLKGLLEQSKGNCCRVCLPKVGSWGLIIGRCWRLRSSFFKCAKQQKAPVSIPDHLAEQLTPRVALQSGRGGYKACNRASLCTASNRLPICLKSTRHVHQDGAPHKQDGLQRAFPADFNFAAHFVLSSFIRVCPVHRQGRRAEAHLQRERESNGGVRQNPPPKRCSFGGGRGHLPWVQGWGSRLIAAAPGCPGSCDPISGSLFAATVMAEEAGKKAGLAFALLWVLGPWYAVRSPSRRQERQADKQAGRQAVLVFALLPAPSPRPFLRLPSKQS